MSEPNVTVVAPGVVRVETDGRQQLVYVAGSAANRWAFWNGHVFQLDAESGHDAAHRSSNRATGPLPLTSPMPATVIKVPVAVGDQVRKGGTLVVLEAMKMEWPVRSLADGIVKAVHCREGELVQADQVLIEMEAGGLELGATEHAE